MNKTLYFFTLIILLGCSNSQEKWYATFDPASNTQTIYAIDSMYGVEMARPYEMILKENILYLEDQKLEKFIHLIDVNKMSVIKSGGVKGKGPGELIAVYGNMSFKKNELWFYDGKLGKYLGYHIDSLKSDNKSYRPVSNELKIDPNLELFKLNWLSDSVVTGYGFSENAYKFTFYNIKNNTETHKGQLPPNPDNTPNRIHKQAYDGIFKIKPNGEKTAFVNLYTDLVEIYNLNNDSTFRLRTSNPFDPLFEIIDRNGFLIMGLSGETRLGYRSLYVTEKNIYALFSGQTMDESQIEKNIFIHTFNWDAEFEKTFKLDRSVISIAVDSNDEYLYAIVDSETPSIYKYKLK